MDRQPARLGLPSKASLGWGVEAGVGALGAGAKAALDVMSPRCED